MWLRNHPLPYIYRCIRSIIIYLFCLLFLLFCGFIDIFISRLRGGQELTAQTVTLQSRHCGDEMVAEIQCVMPVDSTTNYIM